MTATAIVEERDAAAAPAGEAPPDLLALVQEGKDALGRGDLDRALACFEGAAARHPERPEGHNNLGALYTSLGRFPEAEASFGRVLQMMPGNANVHYNRGIVRIHLERYRLAARDFETVLAASPADADCWNNLGVALHLDGEFARAVEKFQRALELSPDFPNALLNLCDSLAASGRREEAVAVCDARLQQREELEIRRKRLDLLAGGASELLARACAAAEELLRQDGQDSPTRLLLGRLLQARDCLEEPAGVA